MPRRRPARRVRHAEGAEDVAPHPKELRKLEETARKEASVSRAKEMIGRGEIWRPGWPGIPKAR